MHGDHPVDRGFERVEVGLVDGPENAWIDVVIGMPQPIGEILDLAPPEVRPRFALPFVRQVPRGFAYDQQQMLVARPAQRVCHERLECAIRKRGSHERDGQLDMLCSINRLERHQKTGTRSCRTFATKDGFV